ncbi:EPIDERMAL PATTERNING FACTOR-like protein 9 isoform X2 [Selaginella moellendorffii]|uniref:EPIDERMAL PATTERNING FACTOR-like protein 9 isoform X2 n=1 Tax=Selaginella moellendorffii TaxID=88036 RepID=UPI000D1C2FAB|nr:EPIDERMAL PATTERNING FACTOR-like protein 9 isoform X2 [Selaginella moellendorffii]|eukprot:XP_024543838.1 EPIDERMAL PATTERNING FACTOR-like protein 9 isoform X2 [Selaginella moellendorffii]
MPVALLLLLLLVSSCSSSCPEEQGSRQIQGVSRKLLQQTLTPKYPSDRRAMVGSTAPSCTYNECRDCKTECRAEQVPLNGRNPKESAYRYLCVCRKRH